MKAFETPNMEIRLKSGPEFHNLDCVFLGIDSGTKPSVVRTRLRRSAEVKE